jgi:hypothetical protein
MSDRQAQLDELLERFREEHPELANQVSAVPTVPPPALPSGFNASISTGTATKPNGLAFLGTGSSGSR